MAGVSAGSNRPFQFVRLSLAGRPAGDLTPTRVTGQEGVCEPFLWRIDGCIEAPRGEIDPGEVVDAIVGKQAHLTLSYSGSDRMSDDARLTRHVHGVVSHAAHAGSLQSTTSGQAVTQIHLFHLELRPALWPLALTRRTCVYNNTDVLTIVRDLCEHHLRSDRLIAVDASGVNGGPFPVEYLVQWQETDLAFMTRILAEVGVWWSIWHEKDEGKLLLGSTPSNFRKLPRDVVPLAPGEGGKGVRTDERPEVFTALNRQRGMVTGTSITHWYDERQPTTVREGRSASTDPKPPHVAGEDYFHGRHATTPDDPGKHAQLQEQRHGGGGVLWRGASDVRALMPGCQVQVTGWDGKPKDLAVLEVFHEASQNATSRSDAAEAPAYLNEVLAVAADSTWRAPLVPRPVIPGLVTAHVDNRSQDTTYADVDQEGRYRVRLHVDRTGPDPGKGSLAVRMLQPYAGPQGAGFHLPLHKDVEVLLAHIDGDPDRPVITAAVPHEGTPSPVTDANHKESVIRTVGQNEITLRDTQGDELFYTFATRDRETEVAHDERREVGNDQTQHVRNTQFLTVGVPPSLEAAAAKAVPPQHPNAPAPGKIGKTEVIAPGYVLAVAGGFQTAVVGAMNTSVGGIKATQVLGAQYELTQGLRDIKIAGDYTVSVKGEHSEIAEKDRKIETKKNLIIDAAETITIRVGKSKITMNKNGEISIEGKELNIKTSADTVIKAKNVKTN